MVFNQYVSQRLENIDHQTRIKNIIKDNPHHKVGIKLGIPNFGSARKTKDLIHDIEKILIYTNWSEKIYNKSDIMKCGAKGQILLENTGFFKPLKNYCVIGVFYA